MRQKGSVSELHSFGEARRARGVHDQRNSGVFLLPIDGPDKALFRTQRLVIFTPQRKRICFERVVGISAL